MQEQVIIRPFQKLAYLLAITTSTVLLGTASQAQTRGLVFRDGYLATAKLASDAPNFDPAAWNNNHINSKSSNCFQYAFSGKLSAEELDKSIPDPGETAGRISPSLNHDFSNLLNALQLDQIEIVSKTLPPFKKGFYLVGLYIAPDHDYHWIRQDNDGGWSEQRGAGGDVKRYIAPLMNHKPQPLPERYHLFYNYTFVGYAYAPAQGIKLGLEKKISEYLLDHKIIKLDDIFSQLTYVQIQQIQKALKRSDPKLGAIYSDVFERYAVLETHALADLLRKDITDPQLINFFKSGNSPFNAGRTEFFGDKIAKLYPELHQTYYDSCNYSSALDQAAADPTHSKSIASFTKVPYEHFKANLSQLYGLH